MKPPSSITVLLAEDDSELRAMLAVVLRRDGHRVVEVRDGGGLMEQINLALLSAGAAEGALIVVSDVRMPGADGLSVMRLLRQQRRRPPFILMTAFGDPALHEQARELGAVAVFDKPFDFDDLRAAVNAAAAVLRPL